MTARPLAFLALLASCSAVAIDTPVNYVDTFEIPHDYLLDGVEGTIWHGLQVNGGTDVTQDTVLQRMDIQLEPTSLAGVENYVLNIVSSHGNWEHANDDGVLLYRLVEGDFIAQLTIIDANLTVFHDLGLMARVPTQGADDSQAGLGEDYVALRYFVGAHNSLRSVDDGATVNANAPFLNRFLRLERNGNCFSFLARQVVSDPWSHIGTSPVLRDDLDGLALQVGIWQATFSGNTGNALVDNFRLGMPDELFADGLEILEPPACER